LHRRSTCVCCGKTGNHKAAGLPCITAPEFSLKRYRNNVNAYFLCSTPNTNLLDLEQLISRAFFPCQVFFFFSSTFCSSALLMPQFVFFSAHQRKTSGNFLFFPISKIPSRKTSFLRRPMSTFALALPDFGFNGNDATIAFDSISDRHGFQLSGLIGCSYKP
jgi:hypothetical protein